MPYSYTSHRIWLPVVFAVAAVALLVVSAPKPSFKPHGIVLPSKLKRAATSPDQVVIYTLPPGNYQVLGTIRIEQLYRKSNAQVKKQLFSYAKALAAHVGANGLLIQKIFPAQLSSEAEGQVIYNVRAQAIYLPDRPFDYEGNVQ